MIITKLFYGLKCDICGHEDGDWYDTPEECREDCQHCDWLHLGDRDICCECYTIDDDDERDIYVTKDGHKYDYDTLKEIEP